LAISSLQATGNSWTAGPLADLSLTYKLKTGEVAVVARQGTSVGVLGDVQERRSVGIRATYRGNSRETISGNVDVSLAETGTASSEYFTAGVRYDRVLAREWFMSISYLYRERHTSGSSTAIGATDSTARSNSLLLTISRDFTVLPPQ
jgi:hypothetical protein